MTPSNENFEFLRRCSEALLDEGSLEQAAETLEKLVLALEQAQKKKTGELAKGTAEHLQEDLIDALEKLGACYYGLQDYSKTVSVYSRLVLSLEQKFGMDDVETIKAVFKLAKACEKSGQREQAQTMYYIAKESAQKALPEENYLRQSITGSYQTISRPKRVTESVNTFVVGDLHDPKELLKAAKTIPQRLKRLSVRGDVFLSIICSLFLVVGSGLWITGEMARRKSAQESKHDDSTQIQARDPRAVTAANSFSTSDGVVRLRFFNDNEAELECENQIIKLPVVRLTESLDSVLRIYDTSLFGKRVWAEPVDNGIKTDGDWRFLAAESPEFKLAEACRFVATTLNDYYKNHSSYPDNKSELIASGRLTYVNPYTGKPQGVSYQNFSQFMQLDYIFDGAKSMDEVGTFLRAGGRWNDEPAFVPGGINVVSRYSGEKKGENFVVPMVFMHVADKERQLLHGDRANTVFVCHLERGEYANDSAGRLQVRDLVLSQFQGKTLFFVTAQGLFTNIWLWKNFTTIVLALALLGSLSWWFIFDARARLKNQKKAAAISELLIISTIIVLLGWIVITLLVRI